MRVKDVKMYASKEIDKIYLILKHITFKFFENKMSKFG